MRKTYTTLLVILALFALFPHTAHADVGTFVQNTVIDPIAKSLEGVQIFYYDFLAIVFDIFTILLFLIWMGCIGLVVWGIYYLLTLPKQLGVNNYHEAAIKIAMLLWEFML